MDRRLFLAAGAAWACDAFAEPPQGGWQNGIHYVTVPLAQPTLGKVGRIEVSDVFSYSCIHCWRLEAHLRTWLQRKPPAVDFVRVPIQWNDNQRAYARLYHTLEFLGRSDLHQAVFDAVHVQKTSLVAPDPKTTAALQSKFAQEHAVEPADFAAIYDSAAVAGNLKRDLQFMQPLPVAGTPTLVVNGKYITDATRCPGAGSQPEDTNLDNLLEITDYLVSMSTH
jgi:protein dithiol oxidoreductase (disulfide-forming)